MRRSADLSLLALVWLPLLGGPLAEPVAAQSSCLEELPGQGRQFGHEVRIDGDTLLVDSWLGGLAHVFRREAGVWELEARIARPNSRFSGSGALSGGRILLGGRKVDPVVMRRDGDRWVREAVLSPGAPVTAGYGQYYALSGDFAAVTDSQLGEVYFFRREGEQWSREDVVQRSQTFGWTIDLDGDVAVVGDFSAPPGESNTAVVLRRTEDRGQVRWATEAELRPGDWSDGCRWFGADVAVSDDVIVVGTAPDFAGNNPPCGRAYVFRYNAEEAEWIEEQVLAPEEVVPRDRFGVSVSVSGDVAAIGAMGDSVFEGGTGFGAVYTYVYEGSEWRFRSKIAPPDQQQDDWFARSVAVSGGTVVAGARNARGGAGAAYVFTLGPQVTITITPERPLVGEEVTFEALSNEEEGHEITAYEWDLGGVTAEEPLVRHSFTEPGRSLVSLVASEASGGCGNASRVVTVTCPPGDIAPWTSGEVGAPVFPGTARFEGEGDSRELVVCAGGDDVTTTSIRPDEFHFVYREVTGDVVLTARISEISSKPLAKAGVMLREGLEPGARHTAMVFEGPSSPAATGRFRFIRREERDGRARAQSGERTETPAAWVQLRREGNELIGLSSIDGETWTEVHRVSLELPETLMAGVAVAGRDKLPEEPYSPLIAHISHLTLSPEDPGGPAFRRGDANSDGTVDIADGITLLNFLFGGASSPSCAKGADGDDSGGLDVSDAIYLFNFLFAGGPSPPPPATECGFDPTEDELTCESDASCP